MKMISTEKQNKTLSWLHNPQPEALSLTGRKQLVMVFDKNLPEWIQKLDLVKDAADLELLIIVLGQKQQQFNLKIEVNHLKPRTRARIYFRAVMAGKSRLEFRGKNHIPGRSGQSETYLKCDTLMLSTECKIKTVPSLEIIASEVKAGHSASTGRPDEQALFYLQSRGWPAEQASLLLARSFLAAGAECFSGLESKELLKLKERLAGLI
jgi:Fe-S cluster assembly scaffold protein SufB